MVSRAMVLVLILMHHLYRTQSWSVWDCRGKTWEIDDSDNQMASLRVQRWITAMQYNCSSVRQMYTYLETQGGWGHHINQGGLRLLMAIEQNQIYRPEFNRKSFVWAESPENCTYGGASLDCYFKPISPCLSKGIETPLNGQMLSSSLSWPLKEGLQNFSTGPLDTCDIAKLSKKSLQWVSGQIYLYLMRLREDIEEEVQELVKQVTSQYNPHNESFISWHMRGGKEMEQQDGRIGVMDVYLDEGILFLDKLAEDVEKRSGKPVTLMYISSDHPDDTYKNLTYMNSHFPRPWKYVDLPRTVIDDGETEYAVNKVSGYQRRLMAVEMLADYYLYAHTDAFVGSLSNVYFIISHVRAALQKGYRPHTCMLWYNPNEKNFWGPGFLNPSLICERSDEMKRILQHVSHSGFRNDKSFA